MKIEVVIKAAPVIQDGVTLKAGEVAFVLHEPSLEAPYEVQIPASDRFEAVRLWPATKALIIADDEAPMAVRRALRHDACYIA